MDVTQIIDRGMVAFVLLLVSYLLMRTEARGQARQDKLFDRIQAQDLSEYKGYHPEVEELPKQPKPTKAEAIAAEHKDSIIQSIPQEHRTEVSQQYDQRVAGGANPLEIHLDEFIDDMSVQDAAEKFV